MQDEGANMHRAGLTHEKEMARISRLTHAELRAEIPAAQLVPQYIVVGYTEDQETEINDIQERDVVRPNNHRCPGRTPPKCCPLVTIAVLRTSG